MQNGVLTEKEEAKQEEYLFSRVLEPHKTAIAEIRQAYNLVFQLLTRFKEINPSVDLQLNQFYVDLFTLIEKSVENIEEDVNSKYDSNAGQGFPDFYTNTDIFKNFYKPLSNLYELQEEGEKLENWETIQNKLNACYAQLDEIFQKTHADDIKDLPHEKLFGAVSDYLEKLDKLECDNLLFNLKQGTIRYKSNPPKEVSMDKQIIKLLILLLRNKGKIVEYAIIGQTLKPNFYHEGLTNKDLGEPMRYLKKDLRKLLISIGMSANEFKTLISTQKNTGYKLNYET